MAASRGSIVPAQPKTLKDRQFGKCDVPYRPHRPTSSSFPRPSSVCIKGEKLCALFPLREDPVSALALVILLLALPAHATDLTGTWRGTISADGQVEDFTASFSDDGYALFDYTNNRGLVRNVELSASKQIQFVPPGGGVTTVAVESVVKRPGGLSYVLHTGFERTSAGYLDQRSSPNGTNTR